VRLTVQNFSSSITSFTNTLLVNARRFPSGEGTIWATHPVPAGISYNTRGLPFSSIERSENEAVDGARANRLFPSAAHLTSCKDCHFQSRTDSTVNFRSARFRIRT